MKNILLLTDFSENSINAMRYAIQLFEDELCNFYVLHVQNSNRFTTDDLMTGGNESIYDTIIKKAKHKMDKLVISLENEFKNQNFSYQTLVDFDVITNAIKQVIGLKNIDLVVMGTNGVTGAREVVFGSNTINVIRKIDCPTLVIPENFKYKKPKSVLLPLDVFDSISGNAFMEVVTFVKQFSKILHILRITPNNEDSKEALKDKEHIDYFLKEIEYKYYLVNGIPMHYVTDCYTQINTIDLTTLLVQKESFFERFFTGSSTTRISNKVRVPLLIFHSK